MNLVRRILPYPLKTSERFSPNTLILFDKMQNLSAKIHLKLRHFLSNISKKHYE